MFRGAFWSQLFENTSNPTITNEEIIEFEGSKSNSALLYISVIGLFAIVLLFATKKIKL